MTTFADKLYEMGGAPVGHTLIPPGGKWFYVDAANGSPSYDGLTPTTAKATIAQAYALTTSGKNDVVCLLASASGTSEQAAITWSNNLTHLIGLGAPSGIAQRTRIVCGTTDLSPFITISGYGCVFSNLYIWQGQDDVHSLINVSVTGNRNYFENVHFAGGGHATQAIDGGASLYLNGGDENRFVHCTIGVDTVAAGTGMMNLLFDDSAARNTFEDCKFLLYAGHTGAGHVEVVDNAGLDRWNEFIRCDFINSCRTYSCAGAFVIPASMTSVTNYLLLKDCNVVGSSEWEANNRGVLYLNTGTITGGTNAGLYLVSAT